MSCSVMNVSLLLHSNNLLQSYDTNITILSFIIINANNFHMLVIITSVTYHGKLF